MRPKCAFVNVRAADAIAGITRWTSASERASVVGAILNAETVVRAG